MIQIIKKKKHNQVTLTIASMLVLATLFTLAGCSSSKTVEKTKNSEAVEEKEHTIEVINTGEAKTTLETVEEPTQAAEGPQTVGQWSETLDRSEPKLTIWNDISKEGIILQNGQKYVLREGDLLVICTKEKRSAISINSPISSEEFKSTSSDKYVKFEFNKEFSEETLFDFTITVAGVEYPFNVTLISENAAADIGANENTEMSGKEWAFSLEYEEAKLVVWNDETGTREVIENGGQYKMQEGDTLAVYYPTGYIISNVTPYDFVESLAMTSKLGIFNYTLPAESQDIDLEVEVLDSADVDSVFNYVITTP